MYKNPEFAIKHNEKTYTVVETDDSGTEKEVEYPVFIRRRRGGTFEVVAPYLYEYFRMSEHIVYLRNNALGSVVRYIYIDGVYRPASDNDISRIMLSYIKRFRIILQSTYPVDEAIRLLDRNSDYITHNQMDTDENIINFQNGILSLDTMKLTPHSPKILSTIQIPCNWEAKPAKTPHWDKYIDTLTAGNADYKKLLFEYIGAVASNVYGSRFKKALFLVGRGDTGKSLISGLLSRILGEGNTSERSLERLGQRFGETAVYMKRLIYSADMSYMNTENLDRFKELTGGDTIAVEFKNKEPFEYRFKGLMLFAMNELPKFGGDKGNHVYDRMIIVKCDNVVPENERDRHLSDKLFEERQGIISKCVLYFCEVLKRGFSFSVPPECITALNEYKTDNSAIIEFWNDCTESREYRDSERITVTEMYGAFTVWNEEQGYRFKPTMKDFKREIAAYRNVRFDTLVTHQNTGSVFSDRKLNAKGRVYLPITSRLESS
jgi:P4 family phage/plasmid primase-like protien